MTTSIVFESVSKEFRGARHYRALRDDLTRLLPRGRRASTEPVSPIRALDDVSFAIHDSMSTGILGLNGAGKSTALKLMSRIMYPSSGTVRVRGRVGALIEVGSGMHPELSGRENVSLYGRIMGLTARDVALRFDEIVTFAGVEHAIDRAVKHYSSGMQLRLGFSIAAHLEPDVMLVDEAISVGDAGFQYRCVERMSQLVREGRTLVLVSHDLSAVETLCSRALLLDGGALVDDGPAQKIVAGYLALARVAEAGLNTQRVVGHDLDLERVEIIDVTGRPTESIATGEPLTIRIHLRAHRPLQRPLITIGLSDGTAKPFSAASMLEDATAARDLYGSHVVDCHFAEAPLNPRFYDIWGSVRGAEGWGDLIDWRRIGRFEVVDDEGDLGLGGVMVRENAAVRIPYTWRWCE
jgi:ABC-type polysaccharide/polyol phosphate transport system ATPase subunit